MGIEIEQTTLTFRMGKPPYESDFIPIDKSAAERKHILAEAEITPGQVAYEKWKELTATLRLWEHLHPAWQERWEQVAQAAIDQHEEDNPRMLSAHD
jgi:hypothetical protein